MVVDRMWKTIKTHDAFCRALLALAWMCGDQERSLLTRTPRSRSWYTGSRVTVLETVSLQLTPFNQLVYLLGSNVHFSILFVTIDPK